MENISLSQKDINEAIREIQTASCCMTEDWFNWVEEIVVPTEVNVRSFQELRRRCLNKELFHIKEISLPTRLKKVYSTKASLKFFSQEYILIGRGKDVKETHLTLNLPIARIARALEESKNKQHSITSDVGMSNSSRCTDVHVIACRDKAIVKRLKDTEVNTVLLICEILQLSEDYHVYDCSSYDISTLSNDNILSNLHRFRKLL